MRIALVAEDYYPQMGGVPSTPTTWHSSSGRAAHTADIFTSHMRGKWDDPPHVSPRWHQPRDHREWRRRPRHDRTGTTPEARAAIP